MTRIAALSVCLLLAACAEAPFADATPEVLANLPAGGRFPVCYAPGTPVAEVDAVAARVCGEHRLTAQRVGLDRFQCRLLAAHRLWYVCR